jgi:enamine deaminase RidA (YjgF/YER057c/UK114 family)
MTAHRAINAFSAPRPEGGYAQAVHVRDPTRLLFISGQVPQRRDGTVPADFRSQAEVTWANLLAQLEAAGMGVENLVKVTTFLASREHAAANREVRQAVLGAHAPALTVVIAEIFDERWLLEIEAIAAA